MSKQKFNLREWQRNTSLTSRDEVEIVATRIETSCTDITPAYCDWRDLGFALAQGLGEEGRAYYHRLSRFYSGYTPAETDKQFTACLRSRGQGVTLNTFFHLARQAGVDINTRSLPDCQNATLPNPYVLANARPSGTPAPVSSVDNSDEVHTPPCPLVDFFAPSGSASAAPQPPGSIPASDGAPASAPVSAADAPLPSPVSAADASADDFPVFPDEVYATLPQILEDVCSFGISSEDTDMLLLGSLTVLSSCLTKLSGIYGQRKVYPNLFLFISAAASAGKGRLTLCRHLVDVVHAEMRRVNRKEWDEYRQAKAAYDKNKKGGNADEPRQPPVRMLFIPANSSSTALFQTLNDNEGQALMFETEGDTLATTFHSEHGNYSDGLRKAFHHEPISYNRRKDREYVEISSPRLAVLLSGTPRQIGALIPDVENGLFSRFLFYSLPLRPVWNDVFADSDGDTLDDRFFRLGGRFYQFYLRLQKSGDIIFKLTSGQRREFNAFFSSLQGQSLKGFGEDIMASVRRLGLTAYRVSMVFSALRMMDYEGDAPLPQVLWCRDDDLQNALKMMQVLLRHTGMAYDKLQADIPQGQRKAYQPRVSVRVGRQQALMQVLPDEFTRTVYQEHAGMLGIPARSADRYIIELCNQGKLERLEYDSYRLVEQD